MLIHCNMRIRPNEIWFLRSNSDFTDRKLEIGVCPKCGKDMCRLIETRLADNVKFDQQYNKGKVKHIMNQYIEEVEYSSLDILPTKGSLYGFRYGETKEKVNKKTGEITITEKACDFYGNKDVINRYTK